jgi:hypothetical protein
MVYGAKVGFDISIAQVLQAVDVVRMPVSEVFDLPMVVLDFPKYLFLVFTILKETHCRPARLWPRFDNAGNMEGEFPALFLERPDNTSAGFVLVEPVTFIKNGYQGGLWYREADLVGRMKFHSESPLAQMRQPCWG